MIRAVLFDFDGLVLDTVFPEYLSWKHVFGSHGFPLTPQSWLEYTDSGPGHVSFSPYDTLEALIGTPLNRDITRTTRRRRFAELMAVNKLLPGVEAMLQEARELELNVGLVTNSRREWIEDYLVRFAFEDRFDAIVCADNVKNTKPHPEPYLTALSIFDVRAEEALALEDSSNGIAAAKAAGIYCVSVPNQLTCFSCLDKADLVLRSLAELPLRELLQHFE